jgi:hypothetical protein
MIDVLFEQRIVQNSALAAESIWQAVHEAHQATGRVDGVGLALTFIVLPITFHRGTATLLAAKTQPGAIYKALAEDRELTVGLQARMQAMSSNTLRALDVAFRTGLLKLDRNNDFQVFPGRMTPPVAHVTDEVKTIMGAAKRVGGALAEMSAVQLSTHLRIQF